MRKYMIVIDEGSQDSTGTDTTFFLNIEAYTACEAVQKAMDIVEPTRIDGVLSAEDMHRLL